MAGLRIHHILLYIQLPHRIYITISMTKKISKKNISQRVPTTPRMTTTRRTILEGEDYVRRFRARLGATRTMRDIAGLKAAKPKPAKKASRVPARPVKPAEKPLPAPKTTKIAKKATKILATKPAKLTLPIAPVNVAVNRTGSRLSNNNKVTKFKTSSRDDLQIPAFGFIDVCFCLDATGSMGS